jgi:pimeloyl-ACP methyl ester carboxylesterase
MVLFQSLDVPNVGTSNRRPPRLLALAGCRRLSARVRGTDGMAGQHTALPLVALHGISRNARALWHAFGPLAEAQGRALLVPHFAKDHWPLFQQIGRARPDLALLDLLQQAGLSGKRVDLFGFSGGAQLAHRFAMLYPHRVGTLHLAAPGWYTFPDTGVAWPLGLGACQPQRMCGFDPASLSRLQLSHYLSLRVRLWVGALDVQRDSSLRQTADLDASQGKTRIARAERYAEAFDRAARSMGITPDIKLTVLPGCGHDFTQCATVGGLAARVMHGA